MRDAAADLIELFSRLAGIVNTSPTSHNVICSRRIDAEFVVVGRYRARNSPDALVGRTRARR